MKKIVAFVLMVIMATTLFTACGGAPSYNANFNVPEGGYDGSEVEITFYHTMGLNLSTVLDEYIVEFNKIYPNIKVTATQEGGYDDVRKKISTELNVGGGPNLAYCYPDHVALYNVTGAVIQLDNLINSTIPEIGLTQDQINDFIPGYYNEGKQFGDNLMYCMPFSKSTEVLYYNKTFFDEHGLETPSTWEQMKKLCQDIKAIDPDCIPLGYDSEANWFITMCEQYGYPYTTAEGNKNFKFDCPENQAFVKEFREWHKQGLVTTQTIYGGYTSGLFIEQEGTNSYMSIGSSAGATHQRPLIDESTGEYPFEVGITTIPQVNPANPKVISQGPSVCIFGKENPQEVIASWLFVKFLTTNVQFQAKFSIASGYVPVLKSVADDPVYAAFIANADGGNFISALSAKACLAQVDAYFTSPAFNGSSVAREQVEKLMAHCLSEDSQDPDSLIDAAFKAAIAECEYQQ